MTISYDEMTSYIFRFERVETIICSEHKPAADPLMQTRATSPFSLEHVALGHHFLGHVELTPHTHPVHHIVSPGHAQLQGLTAPLGHPHHLAVRQIKDINPIDSEENVSNSKSRCLRRCSWFYGGDDNRSRAMDTETKLSFSSWHCYRLIAFYK